MDRIAGVSELLGRLPSTDRKCLSELSFSPDIQAWAVARADQYRKFALTLLSIQNLAAPIHRLPTEILEQILEQCWHNRALSFRLPHVCRLWRSILLDRATFWADAVADSEFREERRVARSEVPYLNNLLARSTRNVQMIKMSFDGFPSSIAKSLTPYIWSLVSLQVSVGKGDLNRRLWPVLRSGMLNLEALTIQIKVTQQVTKNYNYGAVDRPWFHYNDPWRELTVLSDDNLPSLLRLTCPHTLLRYISAPSLRHLRLQWWDISSPDICPPYIEIDSTVNLEPYRERLETLEIMPDWYVGNNPERVDLSSLRYLVIGSDGEQTFPGILDWLTLPPTTRIHLVNASRGNLRHFDVALPTDDDEALLAAIGDVDCLYIQASSERPKWANRYRLRFHARDRERLRMDHYAITGHGLLDVFRDRSSVTRLVLDLGDFDLLDMDLRAFPQLVRLEIDTSELTYILYNLQPSKTEEEESTGEVVCPSLAELAITCRFPVLAGRVISPPSESVSPTDIDRLFGSHCSAIQALTERASRGSRLTSLVFRACPATIIRLVGEDSGSEESEEASDEENSDEEGSDEDHDEEEDSESESEGLADSRNGNGTVDDSDGHDGNSSNRSEDSTSHAAAEDNSDGVWPSQAARQSALQSLQELVDGPVVFKLLDKAGNELSSDEA